MLSCFWRIRPRRCQAARCRQMANSLSCNMHWDSSSACHARAALCCRPPLWPAQVRRPQAFQRRLSLNKDQGEAGGKKVFDDLRAAVGSDTRLIQHSAGRPERWGHWRSRLRPARGVPTGGRMQQCTLSGITGVRGPQSQQALLVDDLLCEVLAARLGPQKYAYWNLRIRPAAPPKRGIRTIAARRASTRPG